MRSLWLPGGKEAVGVRRDAERPERRSHRCPGGQRWGPRRAQKVSAHSRVEYRRNRMFILKEKRLQWTWELTSNFRKAFTWTRNSAPSAVPQRSELEPVGEATGKLSVLSKDGAASWQGHAPTHAGGPRSALSGQRPALGTRQMWVQIILPFCLLSVLP